VLAKDHRHNKGNIEPELVGVGVHVMVREPSCEEQGFHIVIKKLIEDREASDVTIELVVLWEEIHVHLLQILGDTCDHDKGEQVDGGTERTILAAENKANEATEDEDKAVTSVQHLDHQPAEVSYICFKKLQLDSN